MFSPDLWNKSAADDAYTIDNSVRFNIADSASLERTQVSGNRTTWTFSAWVKRGDITSAQNEYFLSTNGSDDNTFLGFYFKGASGTSPDQLTITGNTNAFLRSTQVFRDPSAWYHIVVQANTTSGTAAERLRVWVNGGEITSWAADYRSSMSSMNLGMNESGRVLALGWETLSDAYEFGGYLAEVYLIDGTAYDADDFGELDSDTNQWIPLDSDDVKDAVTFGTNGFYQKYDDPVTTKTFTADGTLTIPAGGVTADILVVAGGGSGGGGHDSGNGAGGGGGAGGMIVSSSYSLAEGSYSITVGQGATASGDIQTQGTNGGNSQVGSISALEAIGGGGGGSGASPPPASNSTGLTGGSGGGSGRGNTVGSGTTDQGNDGGVGVDSGGGGAGGGKGAVGGAGSGNTGGTGGAGTANSITGSSVTYAAGGNGGPSSAGRVDGSDATVNTGNGGGAGSDSGGRGGNGGSGIVVVKYGAGLGADSSGEDNDFTPTNLVATDSMIDTPTNSFCTWNPLWGRTGKMPVLSEGNLQCTSPDAAQAPVTTTFAGIKSGKWYSEILIKTASGNMNVGILNTSGEMQDISTSNNHAYRWYLNTGNKRTDTNASTIAYGDSYTTGDIIGIALDMTNGAIYFSKNNTWQDSGDPTSGASKTGAAFTDVLSAVPDTGWVLNVLANDTSVRYILNAGSDSSFAGNETAQGNQDSNEVGDFYYEPPTDYLALCTDNLSADLDITLPGEYFNTVLYTGDGAADHDITGVGFQPELVWIKGRDVASRKHELFDVIRGAGQYLVSNNNEEEKTDAASLISFDSDGFSVGTALHVNQDTMTVASWNWEAGGAPTADNSAGAGAIPTAGSVKIDGANLGSALAGTIAATRLSANTTSGFSIVTYTGTGVSGATVAHGLSVAPTFGVVKSIDQTDQNWIVGATPLDSNWEKYLKLDTTGAAGDSTAIWNDSPPSATVFSLGDDDVNNKSAGTYVAYLFSDIEGYSKVGSYEGNGDADGTFIYTGFRPAYFLIKNIDAAAMSWYILDNKRNTYNPEAEYLKTESNAAEANATFFDFTSNGVKMRNAYNGANEAYTYLYIAFAESPFKYSNAR